MNVVSALGRKYAVTFAFRFVVSGSQARVLKTIVEGSFTQRDIGISKSDALEDLMTCSS